MTLLTFLHIPAYIMKLSIVRYFFCVLLKRVFLTIDSIYESLFAHFLLDSQLEVVFTDETVKSEVNKWNNFEIEVL